MSKNYTPYNKHRSRKGTFFNQTVLILFLFHHVKTCFVGTHYRPSLRASNEYPQHVFIENLEKYYVVMWISSYQSGAVNKYLEVG